MPLIGQAKQEAIHNCRRPWWLVFKRMGTLWQCGTCQQVYRLEWLQVDAWGCRTWAHYTDPATAPTVEKVNGKYRWEPKVHLPSTVVPVRRKYY